MLVPRLVLVPTRAEGGGSTQCRRNQGELHGGGVTSADQRERATQAQVQHDQRTAWLS